MDEPLPQLPDTFVNLLVLLSVSFTKRFNRIEGVKSSSCFIHDRVNNQQWIKLGDFGNSLAVGSFQV